MDKSNTATKNVTSPQYGTETFVQNNFAGIQPMVGAPQKG